MIGWWTRRWTASPSAALSSTPAGKCLCFKGSVTFYFIFFIFLKEEVKNESSNVLEFRNPLTGSVTSSLNVSLLLLFLSHLRHEQGRL